MTKAPDGNMRAVNCEWRNNHVYTRSVREARIHHRRRFVHAPSDRRDDLVNDVHQMRVVLEHEIAFFKDSTALYVNLPRTIHQDVANCRILEYRLQRTEAENFVQYLQGK